MKIKNHFFIALILMTVLSGAQDAFAQRKDTDAKISIDTYKIVCKNRKTMGNANLRILYAFNATDLKDKSTWIDEGQLKISNGMTQYSSHFEEINEDSLAKWLDEHPNASAYPPARWLNGHNPDYWIEYQYSNIHVKGNVLEEWAAMPRNIEYDNMMYSEPFPLQKWKIENETKTVCGYQCQKATCHWRGRDYTAWFTTKIPVSAGPWKFGGLPGLIMKISDSKNDYSWEAVGVKKGDFSIFAPRRKKYAKSTREKVQKIQREMHEDYIKNTGAMVFEYKTMKPIPSRKHPYSPLELE